MKKFTSKYKYTLLLTGMLSIMFQFSIVGNAVAAKSFAKFNNKDQLIRPTGYRESL